MKRVFLLFLFVIFLFSTASATTKIFIPAVHKTEFGYEGVLATLELRVSEGEGFVFVDTKPFTEIDTQSSARLAVEVASNIANIDKNNYNFYFIIRSDAPIVGGPSAGAAMTVAALAELLNVTLRKDVVITGTINPDGSIGPVGGLLEKAHAVAKNNGTMFLIPKGQRIIRIQETVKTELPGFVEIISKPKTIDLAKYAKEKWNLEVREVSNVEDAFEYMSGYKIKKPEKKEVKNRVLETALKKIAEEMLQHAKNKLNVDTSELPYQYSTNLEKVIDKQKKRIENAERLINERKYYAASSQLFLASVYLTYAQNFVKFFKEKEMLEDHITKIKEDIITFRASLNATKHIDHIADIEIYAAIEERLNDADEHVGKSWKYYYSNDFVGAVYAISYAEERLVSAKQWLKISKYFKGNLTEFDLKKLKSIASERIGDAVSHILYAKLLDLDVKEAEDALTIAEKNYKRGFYSAACFNAVTAKALANLAMELRGAEKKEKLHEYEEDAVIAIDKAEELGAIPILALSFYEYGEALESEDINSALRYLKYAKEFASLSIDFERVVHMPFKENEKSMLIKVSKETKTDTYLILGLLIGIIVGYVVRGIIDVRPYRRRKKVFAGRFA